MVNYLEFRDARCKDCYKCLRECPVKAIEVFNHHARIIDKRCILCGKCTRVCPQNAKKVHSERDEVENLLKSGERVIASVAPSFVSSFGLQDFSSMKSALLKLGFFDAEETAVGAKAVSEEYLKILDTKQYKNFITSACPAVNRMIQLYYPDALQYLAPIVSPMTAHAKILKKHHPDCKIVFICPCIAKKREAKESTLIDGVLVFEDLTRMFEDNNIKLCADIDQSDKNAQSNKARYYPISRGIIKSFSRYPEGYEYVAVDGVAKCTEVLDNINSLSGMFLELNSCEYACINGPCSLKTSGGSVKANEAVRSYVQQDLIKPMTKDLGDYSSLDFSCVHHRMYPNEYTPTEQEIRDILSKTGKNTVEDELNCGACGYSTCREKAWAVANGYANIDMCLPYMRERAESMSYEMIQNSPNGIILLDDDYKILELNFKAKKLLGIKYNDASGMYAADCFDFSDYVIAKSKNQNIHNKKVFISKTNSYVELSIILLKNHSLLYGIMKDITEETTYEGKLKSVKMETLKTTDEVIKKQMRVAQEIASLLGETTAETKVALLKLKKTLQEENGEV